MALSFTGDRSHQSVCRYFSLGLGKLFHTDMEQRQNTLRLIAPLWEEQIIIKGWACIIEGLGGRTIVFKYLVP